MKSLKAFFILLGAINAQFLEQPDAGTVFVSVQDQVTLTCSVEENYLIDWHVVLPNGAEADASNELHRTILEQRGFILEGVTTNRSTLSLREIETQTNNGTSITCVAQEIGAEILPIDGNTIEVTFVGAPPSPTGPIVSVTGHGAFNISWSLRFIEGVPVSYTLTVLNLTTTSAQPIIIAGLLDQHYVFETNRPCDVYSFTVTAVTALGNSAPSQELFIRNQNNGMCASTTPEMTTFSELITTSTTSFSTSTQMSTFQSPLHTTHIPPTQANSTVSPTILIGVIVGIVLIILVLVNAMVCAYCHRKTKTIKVESDPSPVYETPGDVMSIFLAKNTETPFVMTPSSAYGVSMNSPKCPVKSPDNESSFTTTSSSACEHNKSLNNMMNAALTSPSYEEEPALECEHLETVKD